MEGALVLTIAVAIVKIIGAIYKIPLNNILGESGLGYYGTAFNLYNVIYAVTVTGFPVAIARIVSGFATEGRYIDIRRVKRISTFLFIVMGILGTALLVLLAKPYVTMQRSPLAVYAVWGITPSLIFCCLMATYRGYTQGLRNMTPTAMSQVIEVIFKAVSGILLCYWANAHFTAEYKTHGTVLGQIMQSESYADSNIAALTAAGAMLGVSISTLAGFLFLLIRQRVKGDDITREQLSASPRPHANRTLLKMILVIGLPIVLGQAIISLTDLFSESILKNRLFSLFASDGVAVLASHNGVLEQMGYVLSDQKSYEALSNALFGAYNLGLPIYLLIPTITGSFSTSALPHISAAWTAKDKESLKKNIESPLRMTMLIAAPAGGGIVALAGPIMWLLFGRGGEPLKATLATPMMTVLGVAVLFVALSGPLMAMLQGIGRVKTTVVLLVVGCLVKLGVNYLAIGIPQLNVKGMPFGTLLCYIIIVAASMIVLSRAVGFHIDYFGTLVKPLLAGAACGAAAWIIFKIANLVFSSNISTILAILFAAVVYIIALGVLKALSRDDVLGLPKGEKIAAVLEKLHLIR